MRTDPGNAAQEKHHQDRDGPDEHLKPSGIDEGGLVGSLPVRRPVPPADRGGREDDRHHHAQHDGDRVVQDLAVLLADGPDGVEHAGRAAARAEKDAEHQGAP